MAQKSFLDILLDGLDGISKEGLDELRQRARNTAREAVRKTPLSCRQEGLEREFARSIRNKDVDFLAQAVVDYTNDVHEIGSRRLYGLHAKAAILVENPIIGYESLIRLTHPSFGEREVMGLVAYKLVEPRKALNHFKDCPLQTTHAKVVKSAARYDVGKRDIRFHEGKLGHLIATSPEANTFLGTIAFNQGKHELAAVYLRRAADLAPSEQTKLDVIRNQFVSGDSQGAYHALPEFYATTGSSMDHPTAIRELGISKVEPVYWTAKSLVEITQDLF
ncbi:hypothetical protein HOD05_04965 [Candidatus Woesearchaeota archaeon]|nr:hypothetical protein [Candidatus Woesearchaeota archaeon]MBT4150404.1 hypothetical protein [Candidatus Woesearchaeota archaeon]MBT4247404.1 hypothetical protein [Candidatus Woesearchaeota archaeon]MBT4434541.1 hypothetical protein [Candidatus Woesearchaeota archaeon]MBT7331713.1 hypothetical protein [Candidatus Woesearchaeota archaeon]